jgi:asparagine synthetase A
MKVVHGIFYSDEWPNEKLIAKGIELDYEDKEYERLKSLVTSLYGKCNVSDNKIQCSFELQCVGVYDINGITDNGKSKQLQVNYSEIICD